MDKKLGLYLTDVINEDIGQDFSIDFGIHSFQLKVLVTKDKTLEKQLNNKEVFEECLNNEIKMLKDLGSFDEEEQKIYQIFKDNYDRIFELVDYITINFKNKSTLDYIKKNPKLLTKKIVLPVVLKIDDYKKLQKLYDKYKDIKDNIYVYLSGNLNPVSLDTCYKTMQKITEEVNKIASLNLSPMETIMYTYDMVRNREYNKENVGEGQETSRDLSKIIFGDKIVCVGYANLFLTYLNYLGINGKLVNLDIRNNKLASGHARVFIHVKDKKYNIDGVYYFDPTFDSKRCGSNDYLYNYRHFAKTKDYIDKSDNNRFDENYMEMYSSDIYQKVETVVNNGDIEGVRKYFKTVLHMGNAVGYKYILPPVLYASYLPIQNFDWNKFLKKFKKVCDKYKREIPGETMIELFNNVRKLEYYQDSEWYPYSVDNIYYTMMISEWKFKDVHMSKIERLLNSIIGLKPDIENRDPFEEYKNYLHENDIFLETERVQLAKTLQKTLEKKRN